MSTKSPRVLPALSRTITIKRSIHFYHLRSSFFTTFLLIGYELALDFNYICSFSVCGFILQCSYHFQVNSDVIKQGECQKLSMKILEACQQVCCGVILVLFVCWHSFNTLGVIMFLTLVLPYMLSSSSYNVAPLKDYQNWTCTSLQLGFLFCKFKFVHVAIHLWSNFQLSVVKPKPVCYHSCQSQRTQTIQWTNQNLK